MNFLHLFFAFNAANAIFIRTPDTIFSRNDVSDYRAMLLDIESASLFVGAKNRLLRLWAYNINDTSDKLFAEKLLNVSPTELAECEVAGNSPDDCAMSVRQMFLKNQRESLLICSSAALKPEVRVLDVTRLEDKEPPQTVIGLCAPDVHMNTTAVLVESGNPRSLPAVYSGIRTGITGENHLIYRQALEDGGSEVYSSLRTIYRDNNWLNEPQFVGSFDVGEYVYFFFREVANEASQDSVKRIYSRVARVCKQDVGGRGPLRQVWTSFVKARLNCSLPGNYPFYFNHIQSIAKADFDGDTLFYAGMSSSDKAFVVSSICVFPLKEINRILDHSLFVGGDLSVDPVTKHRPGTCVSDSANLDSEAQNFLRTHILVTDAVSGGMPIHPLRDTIFHHIVVDPRTEFNMVFVVDSITSKLSKIAHWRSGSEWGSAVLEEGSQLKSNGAVVAMSLLPGESIFTTTRSQVSQFSLSACEQLPSCQSCAIDPYCTWNVAGAECRRREKMHQQTVGWVTSSPIRGARECAAAARPILKKAFPGDAVYFQGTPGTAWFRDGVAIHSTSSVVLSATGGVVLLDVSKKDNGDYEALKDGRQFVKYRLIVDHEDCAKPKTPESFKAAQREWCKKLDTYKRSFAKWQTWFEQNNSQCPLAQNASTPRR